MTMAHKPQWLKMKFPGGGHYHQVKRLLESQQLHTVCASAHCPNIGECWSRGTATFMILGDRCTRHCGFCAVEPGQPLAPDSNEPWAIAQTVQRLELHYVVITSVTRDDLSDGGAAQFVATINAVRRLNPSCHIEVLIPDLKGNFSALQLILDAHPQVVNHNLETVPRLYPNVRPQAEYHRSLQLLANAGKRVVIKSGLMLGLGELREEILQTALDLRQVGCQILTLGQYLAPSSRHLPVVRYLTPEEFHQLEADCLKLGFERVLAGPMVRSSYHAEKQAPLCT